MDQPLRDLSQIPISQEYLIEDLLGRGGLGSVYKARARTTGDQVVLKAVANVDQEMPRFLLHEYAVLRELNHPNIVRAYDLFRMDDRVFIALEYFNGIECLRALTPPVASSARAASRLVIVLMQILDALRYLHDRHIVHGEVSPTNILIDDNFHVKIVDFELARRLDRDESHLWHAGEIVGIPRYMAPEQARGEMHVASDIFALGVIIFEWLYGRSLFFGTSFQETLRERIERVCDVPFLCSRGASEEVADVLSRMLDPDPDRRAGKHHEFFAGLRSALAATAALTTVGDEAAEEGRGDSGDVTVSAHEWDVAISFAGSDRGVAHQLAALLKEHGLRVFYDIDHQAVLLGADLLSVLQEIYSQKARYCVLLVSQHYVQSDWAWLESRHALARMLAQRTPYVLPVRLDDAELLGLPASVAYLDLRKHSVEEVADTIVQKTRA